VAKADLETAVGFRWQDFLGALESQKDRATRQNLQLPQDMAVEIERLGENRVMIESLMRAEGIESARRLLERSTECAALSEKWLARLVEFASEKRHDRPLPEDGSLSSVDAAVRRILQPKIKVENPLPQLNAYRAPIFTAPLASLPLVIAEWSQIYAKPVFLTPEELSEWNDLYDEPDDAPWWNFYYTWQAEFDGEAFDQAMEDADLSVPAGSTPVLITWGSCVGALAGGWTRELWCIAGDGRESFVDELGISVS
jgi:hypothetical protein